MKIALGSDFAGYSLKESIKAYLVALNYTVTDFGETDPQHMTPYHIPAIKVAEKVQSGEYNRGILCCGTGAGTCIVANKFKGVYAVVCEGVYTANRAAVINGANILTFGERVIGAAQACESVKQWLTAGYLEGIPAERQVLLRDAFADLRSLEDDNFK